MARVFTTFCFVFASVVCSCEAGTSSEGLKEPTGNGSIDATPNLSSYISPTLEVDEGVTGVGVATSSVDVGIVTGSADVEVVTGSADVEVVTGSADVEVVTGSADAISTSISSVSLSYTHTPTPVDATSVADFATTVSVAVGAVVDGRGVLPDAATDAVTSTATTILSGTTQHLYDQTPVVMTYAVSKIKKKAKLDDETTMLADKSTLTPDDTTDGPTVQPPLQTNIDEPVATKSVALDTPRNDPRARLRTNLGGALMPVYEMTSFFLERIVQPHYFSQFEINLTYPDAVVSALERQWTTWAVYFVGFLVCASIGVVLSIITPCVGMCIACCRCGGRCGGKIDPSDGRRAKCQRICCGLVLMVIMATIVVAVVAVFALNERLRQQLRTEGASSFDDISKSFVDVNAYINTTKSEFQTQVVVRCSDHIDSVTALAGNLSDKLVDKLDHTAGVQSALTRLIHQAGGLQNLTRDLNTTEQELSSLQSETTQLLTLCKTRLLEDIANCNVPECNITRERVLGLNIVSNFSGLSLRNLILLDGFVQNGLVEVRKTAEGQVDDIKTAVNESISSHLVKYRATTDKAQAQLRKVADQMIKNINKMNTSYASKFVNNTKENSKGPAYIVYCCVASLALMLCFIVLCNTIGLLYGSFSRRATLTSDGPCDADRSIGANWLLAGVGFTFIFYLFLAVATTALFLAGGLTHTEVCRHLVDYDNPRSAKVIAFIESTVHVPSSTNFTYVYDRCRQNEALYSAFDLETMANFNVSQLIDMHTVRQFVDGVKNISIEVPMIRLLSPELETLLRTPTNISEMCDRLNANITTDHDLVGLSMELDDLKNLSGVAANITDDVNELRKIAEEVATIRGTTKRIVVMLQTTDEFIKALADTVGKLNTSLETINTRGHDISSAFINRTAERIYVGIQELRMDLERSIRNDIGRCRPMYDAVTTIIDTTCIKVLYPINGVWFCLGCCLFLLLPSIVVSFKLVTLYRKLDPYDESPYEYADPIYDAYRPSDYHDFGDQPREMLIQKLDTTRPRSYEPLGPVDNPVYMMDSDVELTGPPDNNRPRFFSPGYPVYAKPAENRSADPSRPSPPPSYESSTGGAESSYDTRL